MSLAALKIDTTRRERPALSFLRLTAGFWGGAERPLAMGLVLVLGGLIGLQIAVQWLWTEWNRWFYDALQARSVDDLLVTLVWLPLIIIGFVAATVALVAAKMTLQWRWREWMVRRLAGHWLKDRRYYWVALEGAIAVPEFRIADDVKLAMETLVDFAVGFATALVGACAFASVLWSVGGSAQFQFLGRSFALPGYLALGAVVYAGLVSIASMLAGWRLTGVVSVKNEMEANLRAAMTRIRENAESVALIDGDARELSALMSMVAQLRGGWMRVIGQNTLMAVVVQSNGAIFPLVPLLLAAPKYLSGELTLGQVMQLVAAFSATQGALMWFVDNAVRLAEWRASAARVEELRRAFARAPKAPAPRPAPRGVAFDGVTLRLGSGAPLVRDFSLRIEPGEKVLVAGRSGIGKSTIVRAMAGLWPVAAGEIRTAAGARIAFAPQRPYIPLGPLRDVLTYPGVEGVSDAQLIEIMDLCGLKGFASRLDDHENWHRTLSGGEQQRIGFVRLLLARPDIVVMDESTSTLDEAGEAALMRMLSQRLAEATWVSVAHRPQLEAFHHRKLTLRAGFDGCDAVMSALRPRPSRGVIPFEPRIDWRGETRVVARQPM